MATCKVLPISGVAPAGAFQGPYTGSVNVGSDGAFTIDTRDINVAVNGGYMAARTDHTTWFLPAAAAAASAGLFFASAALSNGTKAIAAQATEMRPAKVVVLAGTTAITAGTLTLTYDANDGTPSKVDALSLVTAAGTAGQPSNTLMTSRGVMRMRSQIVTGLVGGTSPTFYIGTDASLSVPVQPNAQDAVLVNEWLDGAVVAVGSAGTLDASGHYVPSTAPNATHTYGLSYTTLSPNA